MPDTVVKTYGVIMGALVASGSFITGILIRSGVMKRIERNETSIAKCVPESLCIERFGTVADLRTEMRAGFDRIEAQITKTQDRMEAQLTKTQDRMIDVIVKNGHKP
jgi:hypothetical protein